MSDISPVVVWTIAAVVGLLTPVMGYFSPFGRIRRGMVSDLQNEIVELRSRVGELRGVVASLTRKVELR